MKQTVTSSSSFTCNPPPLFSFPFFSYSFFILTSLFQFFVFLRARCSSLSSLPANNFPSLRFFVCFFCTILLTFLLLCFIHKKLHNPCSLPEPHFLQTNQSLKCPGASLLYLALFLFFVSLCSISFHLHLSRLIRKKNNPPIAPNMSPTASAATTSIPSAKDPKVFE